MSRIIEIVVKPDGNTTVQTKGFAGSSCREATRFLEKALGQVAGEQLTAEFHNSSASVQQSISRK
jgi:hypothetical protein